MRLILASASPRRHELLRRLGVPFEIRPSEVDEALAPDEPVAAQVAALARAKAGAVAARLRGEGGEPAVVLAADTLVALDDRPLGKPGSRAEARAMLRALRGRPHAVLTALAAVEVAGDREATATVTSRVVMRDYADREIDAYVATGEPDDKAGAYAVQGAGAALVARVEGCYTNVVGLPLTTTARLLERFGFTPARP
jgi:septum formation protein